MLRGPKGIFDIDSALRRNSNAEYIGNVLRKPLRVVEETGSQGLRTSAASRVLRTVYAFEKPWLIKGGFVRLAGIKNPRRFRRGFWKEPLAVTYSHLA